MENRSGKSGSSDRFIFLGSKITVDSDGSLEIKRCLFLGRKALTNPGGGGSESCSVVSDSLQPHGLYSLWNSPGHSTRVGSLFLLQGIFPTQRSNPSLPHGRWILYQLSHKGNPRILEWVDFPFSSGSSQPRKRTGVSCIAGGFFTNWAIREAHDKLKQHIKKQRHYFADKGA